MAARVTQSMFFTGAFQAGDTRVTQSILIFGVGVGVSCANPPTGNVGVFYSHTFPAGSGTPPYTFAISAGALPPGLTLNATTGAATGTPTAAGTFGFTVQVTDSMGAVAAVTCSIVILAGPGAITGTYGGAKKGCAQIPRWKRPPVDWSGFSRILDAVRPEPLEECNYDADDARRKY